MRYPPEETAERHERIVEAASRMFRARGFDGVSVADVMKAAGLTHGAFPAHFPSKEAMVVAGIERALTDMLALADRAAGSPDPKGSFIAGYLSAQHRDNPDQGCVMAALAPEIARKSGGARGVFTTHVAALVDRMASAFFSRSRARARAIATLSTLVGAVTLARAVDDPTFSAEILVAARAHLGVDIEAAELR